MRFPRPVLLLAALVAGLAVAACGSEAAKPHSAVFGSPPWQAAETLQYDLTQKSVDNEATCTLKTDPAGNGQATLSRLCSDNRGNKDDGVATVDNATLEPKESTRTTFDADANRTTTHTVVYSDSQATFETTSRGKTRSTTRDLPAPTEAVPEPAWYDDESLLWLVRGIKLEEGYEATYTHVINAGQPRVLSVDLNVRATENIEVPAGKFNTWRIRVSRESSVYTIWVDVAAPHLVVRALIEDSTYELVSVEQ